MTKSLPLILFVMLFAWPVMAQSPVPSRYQDSITAQSQESYFAGATAEDKQFIDGIRAEADKRGVRGLKRWRLERRLRQQHFVEFVKSEVKQELYWDNPIPFGDPAEFDWDDIDWDKVFAIVMQILEIFLKLFA